MKKPWNFDSVSERLRRLLAVRFGEIRKHGFAFTIIRLALLVAHPNVKVFFVEFGAEGEGSLACFAFLLLLE